MSTTPSAAETEYRKARAAVAFNASAFVRAVRDTLPHAYKEVGDTTIESAQPIAKRNTLTFDEVEEIDNRRHEARRTAFSEVRQALDTLAEATNAYEAAIDAQRRLAREFLDGDPASTAVLMEADSIVSAADYWSYRLDEARRPSR